jgi:hypothetical protein
VWAAACCWSVGGGVLLDLFVVDVNATNAQDDRDGVSCHERLVMHLFCGSGGSCSQEQPFFFVDLLADTQRINRLARWEKAALGDGIGVGIGVKVC